jgi:hypothetical protein
MPCGDGGVPYPPTREEELAAKTPQMLCGILKALTGTPAFKALLGRVDWKEAGVMRAEFDEWWLLHSRADTDRRMNELKAKREDEARKKALAKLTKAERKLLGHK